MKRFYLLFILAAALAACTREELPQAVEEPEVSVYTLTVEATKGGDDATRALSLSGKTLSATWAEGERVTVRNVTRSADLGGYLEAQTSGVETTLKGTLSGTIEENDELLLCFLSPSYNSQDGTLAYIAANCDYAEATVSVTDSSTPNVTTTAADFQNRQAIVKFTLRNKAGNANLHTNSLRISNGTHTYTINRQGSADPYYVAIPGFSGKTISLIAIDGGTGYECIKSAVSFSNGQYYEVMVKMSSGHAYVDLGLPSGTLWATCNIGATSPEGYGDYFAWGEVEPYYSSLDPLTWKSGKENGYTWSSYRYENSAGHDGSSFSKYTGSDYSVLQPEDDAATYNWGGNWRMPTNDELQELFDNTNAEWTTINSVNGYMFKKITDASVFIFLPSGVGFNGATPLVNYTAGEYWSSTDDTGTGNLAKKAYFASDGTVKSGVGGYRSLGRNVRPVLAQ